LKILNCAEKFFLKLSFLHKDRGKLFVNNIASFHKIAAAFRASFALPIVENDASWRNFEPVESFQLSLKRGDIPAPPIQLPHSIANFPARVRGKFFYVTVNLIG